MTTGSDTAVRILDEDPHVSAQLRAVESRLVSSYAGHSSDGEDWVRRTIATVEARFAEARVRTFVPILVERAARAELERQPVTYDVPQPRAVANLA